MFFFVSYYSVCACLSLGFENYFHFPLTWAVPVFRLCVFQLRDSENLAWAGEFCCNYFLFIILLLFFFSFVIRYNCCVFFLFDSVAGRLLLSVHPFVPYFSSLFFVYCCCLMLLLIQLFFTFVLCVFCVFLFFLMQVCVTHGSTYSVFAD